MARLRGKAFIYSQSMTCIMIVYKVIFLIGASVVFDKEKATFAIQNFLQAIGLDYKSDELIKTPSRVANYWLERVSGYDMDLANELKVIPNQLIPCPLILEKIPFLSICEHHLVPFHGFATIGYIPGSTGFVGVTKLVKIIHGFANRLQIQERMTYQIANALQEYLKPMAWGIKLTATHTCMACYEVGMVGVPVVTVLTGGQWSYNIPQQFL